MLLVFRVVLKFLLVAAVTAASDTCLKLESTKNCGRRRFGGLGGAAAFEWRFGSFRTAVRRGPRRGGGGRKN